MCYPTGPQEPPRLAPSERAREPRRAGLVPYKRRKWRPRKRSPAPEGVVLATRASGALSHIPASRAAPRWRQQRRWGERGIDHGSELAVERETRRRMKKGKRGSRRDRSVGPREYNRKRRWVGRGAGESVSAECVESKTARVRSGRPESGRWCRVESGRARRERKTEEPEGWSGGCNSRSCTMPSEGVPSTGVEVARRGHCRVGRALPVDVGCLTVNRALRQAASFDARPPAPRGVHSGVDLGPRLQESARQGCSSVFEPAQHTRLNPHLP